MIAIFIKGRVKNLLILISTVQIVVYMPIFNVDIAPNTEIFLERVRKIAEFDIVDVDKLISWAQQPQTLIDSVKIEHKNSGFQTPDFFDNVKSFLLLIAFNIFIFIAIWTIGIIPRFRQKAEEFHLKLKQKWIWNYTLLLLFMTYLKVVSSIILASGIFQYEINYYFMALLVVYLYLPYWSYKFLKKTKEDHHREEFVGKYGTLLDTLRLPFEKSEVESVVKLPGGGEIVNKEEVRLMKNDVASYPMVWMLRRILFAVLAFGFRDRAYFACQGLNMMGFFNTIYLGLVRPNRERKFQNLELFNEWCIQIFCLHMFCFTDFVSKDTEPNINYYIGESFIYCFVLLMAVNFGFMAFLRRRIVYLWLK